ncbi:tape measure protein [Roseitalea porphyridii]|uniref:Tape measure protein N-terminal domain-containing protein n=1 Tax=Roseitalea porphyridii TaxID=1852022 RepID=A0A4P6V1N1_9HYPH|nr:tape measure protein [Roseitalea porphyridii]QBK30773.1 hypothetical protein E0E05_09315 [Roseitalea porphyridii]
MATEVERLIVRLEASQAKFDKQLAKANQTANRRARAIEGRFDRMNKRLSAGFSRLGGAFAAAFASAVTVRGAQALIDSATRIQNALRVAGLEGEQLSNVYGQLFTAAQRASVPIEDLVELYSRAALRQKELGVTSQELITFSENVAVAIRVAGQSSQEASGALLQLSQALGSGIVRAEEFNSILDGAPTILQAVAAGLEEAGGSVAKLRQMVNDGEISSQAFFRAFEAGAVTLEEKFAATGRTVGDGLTNIQNALKDAAGEFNRTTDTSGKLAAALNDLAGGIEYMGDVAVRVAEGPLGTFIGRLGQANELARQFLALVGKVSLNDEIFGAVGGFIAPQADPAAGVDPARFGGALPVRTAGGKAGRLGGAGVNPISAADYPVSGGARSGRGGGGKSRARRTNELEREIAQLRERTEVIRAETRALAVLNPLLNDYGASVEKARAAVELETAARKAGLAITPELKAQINTLAGAYANASAEAEKLAESQDRAREAAEDMRALGKDVLGGFISDLRSGKSAADALASALDKVIDRMLDSALDSLFSGGLGVGARPGGIHGTIMNLNLGGQQ